MKTYENFITDFFKKEKKKKDNLNPLEGEFWFIPYTKPTLIEIALAKLAMTLNNPKDVNELIEFYQVTADDFHWMLQDKKGFYMGLTNFNDGARKWTLVTDSSYLKNFIDNGTIHLDDLEIDTDKYNL